MSAAIDYHGDCGRECVECFIESSEVFPIRQDRLFLAGLASVGWTVLVCTLGYVALALVGANA